MFKVVPMEMEHLTHILSLPENAAFVPFCNASHFPTMKLNGAIAGILNGKVVCVGGINKIWHGRGAVWALMDSSCGCNFVSIFRTIKKWLEKQLETYHRIELSNTFGFRNGDRRAKMLGFSFEGLASKYLPTGEDCTIWVLLREAK